MNVGELELKISIYTIRDGNTVSDKTNFSLIFGLFASQAIKKRQSMQESLSGIL